jgi:hypothetical protein
MWQKTFLFVEGTSKIKMNRLSFLTGALALSTLGALLSGCGSSGTKVTTGTQSGTLADMLIRPAPGAFAISRDTVFRLEWPEGTTPPPEFTVRLYKYQDERGPDFPRESVVQETRLTRLGDRFSWDLARSGNLALDSGGVYYIQVKAGTEEVFASYIVAVSRGTAPKNTGEITKSTSDTDTTHRVVLP